MSNEDVDNKYRGREAVKLEEKKKKEEDERVNKEREKEKAKKRHEEAEYKKFLELKNKYEPIGIPSPRT